MINYKEKYKYIFDCFKIEQIKNDEIFGLVVYELNGNIVCSAYRTNCTNFNDLYYDILTLLKIL